MLLIYYTSSLLLGGIISLGSGFFAYLRNTKHPVNKSWLYINIASAVWSFGYFAMVTSTTKDFAWYSNWILHGAAIFIPTFYTQFALALTNNLKKFRVYLLISYAISMVLFIINPTHFFISDVKPKYIFNYVCDAGSLYILFATYFFASVTINGFILRRTIMHTTGVVAQQLKYVFFASLFGFVGGGSVFLLTFNVPVPPFLIILYTLYPLVITYAIIRYRFMDVRLIIVRTMAFGFIVALLVAVYAAVSTLIALFFESIARVQSNIIVSVITSLFVVLGYSPLKKFIERATETFLFKKSYDPDKLLASVTEVTSSILDLSQLLKSLSKVMGDAFHYEKFGITLLDEKNKMEIFYKEGFKPAVAEGLVSYKGVTEALYKELEQVSGLLVIDEMKTRFENGEFKPADPVLLNLLHENDIAVIVPLYVKDRLIGIFAVGNKKSGDSYNTQDLNILKIIAGQAGIAIENARLYEELKTFNIKLEHEVRRKTMQLRRANTDLKQLDKAKSEFISIASHQLRTPLTVIKGYISMMQEGSFGAVPPPIAENLKKVFISNERLIQLVEDLLDISRIESGRQEFNWAKIRLENLAQTVVDNLMQNAGAKDLKLAFHKPAKPTPEVVADENKLHEVMMNFVDNAIKYTPGGQIDVFVRVDKGDVVTFCVKDTGKGITSELQDVLFKKFSRGKDSFRSHTEGLGLGLYVAKLMMEAHKGKIWAESDGEGKGSSFCFSIPVKGVELKAGEKSEGNLIKPVTGKPAVVTATSK